MTDGATWNIVAGVERDPMTLGFVDAIRGIPIEDNAYVLARDVFYPYDRWRVGWQAYHRRYIPTEVQQALHDVPQMRNPLTQEHLQTYGYLPEPLADLLKQKCMRP